MTSLFFAVTIIISGANRIAFTHEMHSHSNMLFALESLNLRLLTIHICIYRWYQRVSYPTTHCVHYFVPSLNPTEVVYLKDNLLMSTVPIFLQIYGHGILKGQPVRTYSQHHNPAIAYHYTFFGFESIESHCVTRAWGSTMASSLILRN